MNPGSSFASGDVNIVHLSLQRFVGLAGLDPNAIARMEVQISAWSEGIANDKKVQLLAEDPSYVPKMSSVLGQAVFDYRHAAGLPLMGGIR
jgi:hypothetical protein